MNKNFMTEESVNTIKQETADIFESIEKHEGKSVARFTHALVSMRNVCEAFDLLCQTTTQKAIETNDLETMSRIAMIAGPVRNLITSAICQFYECTDKSFEVKAAIEWCEKINSHMESGINAEKIKANKPN